MEQEIWQPIKGYEGYYEISSFGRVKSIERTIYHRRRKENYVIKEKILTPALRGKYLKITLFKNNKRYQTSLHSLVLKTFVGNRPSPKHQTRHLDGNRFNNKLSNLAWGTCKQNHQDRKKHGTLLTGDKHPSYIHPEIIRRGELNGMSKLTKKQILEIRNKYIPKIYSQSRLAKEYNVSQVHIWRIVNNKSWEHIIT